MDSRRRRRRTAILYWLLLPGSLLVLGSCLREPSPDELLRHVEYLSSDRLEGRQVGGAGIAEAERYIARRFRAYGLRTLPAGKDYFQDFTLRKEGFDPTATGLAVSALGHRVTGTAGRDFRPFVFSAQGERSAPVVFAGYGITAPEYGYDDYQGLDVSGKFVLLLRHEPGNEDPQAAFAGTAATRHSYFLRKAENALRHGAAGMVLVNDPLTSGQDEDLRLISSYSLESAPAAGQKARGGGSPVAEGFLAVQVREEMAEAMIFRTGLSLVQLQRAVDGGRLPRDIPLGEVRADIRVRRQGGLSVQARNVVGFLEGADPRLKHEWIVIGAHHDHLGRYEAAGDTIYNGADDNASGVAGVLALARAFARRGAWAEARPDGLIQWSGVLSRRPLARSLVFAAFSAEEEGLFGSKVLADELMKGSDHRVVLMFNLDMIGRNPDRPVDVFGEGFSPEVRRNVELQAGKLLPLRFAGSSRDSASDHLSFNARGVPVLFFFSGMHGDYHGLEDEAEKLNYPRVAAVVNLVWRVVSSIAEQLPPFRAEKR